MHGQVQEGIGLAAFDGIVAAQRRIDIGKRVVVLGMLDDPVERYGFERGEDFAGAVLAIDLAKKVPHVVGGRVEHGGMGRIAFNASAAQNHRREWS